MTFPLLQAGEGAGGWGPLKLTLIPDMPTILTVTKPRLTYKNWVGTLRQHRIIAVIRADSVAQGLHMAQAAAAGGIRLIEITWNSEDPVTLLRTIQQALPECWVGVGTVLSTWELESAIATGAEFCFTPHTAPALIQQARIAQIPISPGAMTPTEILSAWQAGAASVKVFPIRQLGGGDYVRALQGPLGQVPLIPTGGVDEASALDLLSHGAIAVGLSSGLFLKQDVHRQNWRAIQQRATQLMSLPASPKYSP